jgi:hypothetical protein
MLQDEISDIEQVVKESSRYSYYCQGAPGGTPSKLAMSTHNAQVAIHCCICLAAAWLGTLFSVSDADLAEGQCIFSGCCERQTSEFEG